MKYRFFSLLLCYCVFVPTIAAQTVSCIGTLASRLVIGEQAQVIASGGSNLRARPYADSTLLNVIPENELIPVIDGPYCADGYAWWQIDYDGDRGWIAEGTSEFYWLAPYIIQRAQIGTVRIEIQPNLITGITLERLADPLRSQFVLEGFPVTSNQIVPFIVVFDEAPADISLDDLAGNAIAQVETLEMGTRFVDIFFTEALTETSQMTLIYHYIALTEDNRYIDAYFPISAPDLPLAYTASQDTSEYLENTVAALDALSPDAFTPTLAQLDSIVRSIQPDAPLEESDVLRFSSSGIHFDYNPILATNIREALVPAGDFPQHIQLTLENYPVGEAIIRIYRTEDMTGGTLSALQQILSRQPNNPPQIPVPSQTNAPLSRENIAYLNFVNGEGVRYIASFIEDEQVYGYQGLSANGDYFVSVLLPIENDFPPISILDRLIQSLQIGE